MKRFIGFSLALASVILAVPTSAQQVPPRATACTSAERSAADKQIREVKIKTASREAPASSLSGGNQQKIVVGKWLNHGADLYIFDEPTVGVDVGTKVEIYKLFAKLLKDGAGIILISSYLPEVYDLSDTLHVFRRGRLVASYDSAHVSEKAAHETVLTQALGV